MKYGRARVENHPHGGKQLQKLITTPSKDPREPRVTALCWELGFFKPWAPAWDYEWEDSENVKAVITDEERRAFIRKYRVPVT